VVVAEFPSSYNLSTGPPCGQFEVYFPNNIVLTVMVMVDATRSLVYYVAMRVVDVCELGVELGESCRARNDWIVLFRGRGHGVKILCCNMEDCSRDRTDRLSTYVAPRVFQTARYVERNCLHLGRGRSQQCWMGAKRGHEIVFGVTMNSTPSY
jgi:hypothetical protein